MVWLMLGSCWVGWISSFLAHVELGGSKVNRVDGSTEVKRTGIRMLLLGCRG